MKSNALQREKEQYQLRTPKARELNRQAKEYLPGGSSRGTAYFDPYPIVADRGADHYLYDVDGNAYLDFMINATSLILGHAHPDIVGALQEQAARGTAFSAPTELQTRLASILCERIPSVDRIRFTNSGTEGTLMAIRAARAYTGRHKIAKFEGGYHGSHEYAAVSVRPPASALDPEGPTAIAEHPGQPPSVAEGVVTLPYNNLEESRRILKAHAHELSCVIMEPIASALGYVPADPEFLSGIREVTQELGLLLIFDEVQSFRAAPGGAQQSFNVTPDMTCLGKIIGGGLPVGAFGGREDVMALFDPSVGGAAVAHAGTFNANPMTLTAGTVVMEAMTPDVYERLNALGETLRAKLRAVFDELEVPCQITGTASFFGIHITSEPVNDYRSALRSDKAMRDALFLGLVNEGVLLQETCSGALSTLTTEAEVDALVDAVRTVLQRIRD